MNIPDREAQKRAERVLRRHGVHHDALVTLRQGDRPKAEIDAIIRDVQKANAEAEE